MSFIRMFNNYSLSCVGFATKRTITNRLFQPNKPVLTIQPFRMFATVPPTQQRGQQIRKKLSDGLQTNKIIIEDVSGGCGTFYRIQIISPLFNGKTKLEQHRLVNDLIKEEVTEIHGLTLQTQPDEPQ
eukprot:TRINITY_DN5268_c0_g1_i1.p1 TRINITY_DN5268_c0_g1~~TRINITY_DN5268_c0_g1_i1.p1  ORF type:complete len:128 (+),score=17.61 TRINITY_DN5268_c0_g1_i1:146-529(+)